MNTLNRLGPVAQIAYVVPNLQEAIRQWVHTLGIGPWLVIPHIEYREHEYEGRSTRPDISIALANSGETQIELVEQHNDEPCVFLPFRRNTGNAMHHIAVLSRNLEEDERRLVAAGMRRLQRGLAATGAETLFLAGGNVLPGLFELIRLTDPIQGAFQWIKQCAATWDGKTETVQFVPPQAQPPAPAAPLVNPGSKTP